MCYGVVSLRTTFIQKQKTGSSCITSTEGPKNRSSTLRNITHLRTSWLRYCFKHIFLNILVQKTAARLLTITSKRDNVTLIFLYSLQFCFYLLTICFYPIMIYILNSDCFMLSVLLSIHIYTS